MKFKLIPIIVLIIFSTLKGISQNQENKIPIIIDADTANEIDDLFALSFEYQPPTLPSDANEIESVNVELLKSSPPAAGPLPGSFLPNDIPKK